MDYDAGPVGLGVVVERTAASLPFALLHGEALVACAAWALGEAGVDLLDASVPWEAVGEAGRALVLHDALCPMTPPAFLAACVRARRATGRVVVGVRPVTDTVKEVADGAAGPVVGDTLDRDGLRRRRLARSCSRPPSWPRSTAGRPPTSPGGRRPRAAGHRSSTLEAPARGSAGRPRPTTSRLLEALTAAAELQLLGQRDVLGEGDLEVGGAAGRRPRRRRRAYALEARRRCRCPRSRRPRPRGRPPAGRGAEGLRGLHADHPLADERAGRRVSRWVSGTTGIAPPTSRAARDHRLRTGRRPPAAGRRRGSRRRRSRRPRVAGRAPAARPTPRRAASRHRRRPAPPGRRGAGRRLDSTAARSSRAHDQHDAAYVRAAPARRAPSSARTGTPAQGQQDLVDLGADPGARAGGEDDDGGDTLAASAGDERGGDRRHALAAAGEAETVGGGGGQR